MKKSPKVEPRGDDRQPPIAIPLSFDRAVEGLVKVKPEKVTEEKPKAKKPKK